KIKMCGIRRPEDISFANAVRPDYIGYVFYEKSKRYVTPSAAVRLSSMLDDSIVIVGVFVDAPADEVITLYKSGTIGIAQLHGSEDDNYIMQMKNAGVPTIKAFIIRSEEDIERAEKCPADMVLLDSGMGSGCKFDHSLVAKIRRPYFLAGGLSPDNAAEAVEALHPYAVDASSGLETDGFKDLQKMRLFAERVRNCDK
ncbi:MAG: phosphoribosylanthranilate isomerase, partial [Ruminococcus sp.]|nr:phosphoribosylanthranilate isomerase [Ruminococcus sp.]